MSAAWYTLLEQGRDIHPSSEAIEAMLARSGWAPGGAAGMELRQGSDEVTTGFVRRAVDAQENRGELIPAEAVLAQIRQTS